MHIYAASERHTITHTLTFCLQNRYHFSAYRHTPLHHATDGSHTAVCQLLIDRGVDVNVRNEVNAHVWFNVSMCLHACIFVYVCACSISGCMPRYHPLQPHTHKPAHEWKLAHVHIYMCVHTKAACTHTKPYWHTPVLRAYTQKHTYAHTVSV